MRARHALAALTAAAALGGCSVVTYKEQGVATPVQDCQNQPVCNVRVDPANGMVPREILVTRNRETKIHWNLAAGGYGWRGRGIEFEAAASGEIECPMFQVGSGRSCTKKALPAGGRDRYKYTVRLVNPGRAEILEHDPFVLNR